MVYHTFLCAISVIMFTIAFCLFDGSGERQVLNKRPCNYELDLPKEGLILETSEIGNQSVQTLTFTIPDVPTRRKRGLVPEATFMESSPYFVIVNNEIVILTCPPVGQTHLGIILDENSECVYNFSVTVNPSKAEITAPKATTVMVGSAVGGVDVLEITIENEGQCTNFVCSAIFIDTDVNVWIDKGIKIIRISPDDIHFGMVYQLRISCDTPVLGKAIDEEMSDETVEPSVAIVQVTFIDSASMTSGKLSEAVNSTATPAFLYKAYLSVRLVMPMTVILRGTVF